jgi:hypothetical protein
MTFPPSGVGGAVRPRAGRRCPQQGSTPIPVADTEVVVRRPAEMMCPCSSRLERIGCLVPTDGGIGATTTGSNHTMPIDVQPLT